MRTRFMTTLALAALMTVGGAALAAAQTCRAPAPNESGYGSRRLSLEECQQASISDTPATIGAATPNGSANASGDMPTYGGFAPNVGPQAHYHPHGTRSR